MISINRYSVKQVRESIGRYDLEKIITSPNDVIKLAQTIGLEDEAQEKFVIATLNSKNEIAGLHVIAIGSLNSAIVHPREVFKAALLNNAASLICIHNHPSGDPTPSNEDIEITKRLKKVGDIMGIPLVDHVIIGSNNRYISMKEKCIF